MLEVEITKSARALFVRIWHSVDGSQNERKVPAPCFHHCTRPHPIAVRGLQRHTSELAAGPSERMPWNYRETLERAGGSTDSGWNMMNPMEPEPIAEILSGIPPD